MLKKKILPNNLLIINSLVKKYQNTLISRFFFLHSKINNFTIIIYNKLYLLLHWKTPRIIMLWLIDMFFVRGNDDWSKAHWLLVFFFFFCLLLSLIGRGCWFHQQSNYVIPNWIGSGLPLLDQGLFGVGPF
jgi:RsiW-degrading membrane proteinase PrsW (M82 family)